jgi:hypothetical protein
MSTTPGNASDCIIERETPHGYWWRYQHSDDEPRDTLLAAIMVAGEVAATEARKRNKAYYVARAAYIDGGPMPSMSLPAIIPTPAMLPSM